MYDYQVTIAPSHFPISLAEAKRTLKVTDSNSDTEIGMMIAAAAAWAQQYENQSYLYQTIEVKLDQFENEMVLPAPPLISVDSITYIDINGVEQTLSADVYDVDTHSFPGRVTLGWSQSWPSIRNEHHPVTITIKAGFVAPFTADAGTDNITVAGHRFNENDMVHVYTSASDLPAGLATHTDYYILSSDAGTYQLAATEGGAKIDITDTGTGTHYIDAIPRHKLIAILIRLVDLFDHRSSFIMGRISPAPAAAEIMLGPSRMNHV
jgi:hypothetical protein